MKKLWENTDEIPESVTVSLLKDGTVVENYVLNAGNNWHHKWEKLDKNHSWNVVETDVPEGYNASYKSSQMSVTITNRKKTPPTPTEPEEGTTKPEELIQTGQLNWPVPIFSIAGLLLFSVGWMLLNFGNKDEEAV